MKVLGKKMDLHTTSTFMKKEAEAENVELNVKPNLNEHVSYTKSKGFEKRNMSLIQESDLSGYEFIGRDCMVTV